MTISSIPGFASASGPELAAPEYKCASISDSETRFSRLQSMPVIRLFSADHRSHGSAPIRPKPSLPKNFMRWFCWASRTVATRISTTSTPLPSTSPSRLRGLHGLSARPSTDATPRSPLTFLSLLRRSSMPNPLGTISGARSSSATLCRERPMTFESLVTSSRRFLSTRGVRSRRTPRSPVRGPRVTAGASMPRAHDWRRTPERNRQIPPALPGAQVTGAGSDVCDGCGPATPSVADSQAVGRFHAKLSGPKDDGRRSPSVKGLAESVGTAHEDRGGVGGELPDLLPASAAGGTQMLAAAGHGDLRRYDAHRP